jgi:hypothetical protein
MPARRRRGGTEGDGSSCGNLFTATDTLSAGNGNSYSGSIAPSDTLQAAFNIAQLPALPSTSYRLDQDGNLFSLATSSSPFQPILTTSPNDYSVSLNYTGGGGLTTTSTRGSFAVDNSGNLWITDTTAGDVIEWNTVGAALSPSTGFSAGGSLIAIDASGNVWVSGNSVLSELTNLGTAVSGSPYAGVTGGGNDVAFDAQDNLWIANGAGVNEFSNLGAELSPAAGYTNSGVSNIAAVGIDSSNNVWVGNSPSGGSRYIAEQTNPGGELIVNAVAVGVFLPGLAANGAGDVWGLTADGSEICEVTPYGGKGTVLEATCYQGGS